MKTVAVLPIHIHYLLEFLASCVSDAKLIAGLRLLIFRQDMAPA